jgi:hypothetical protein
MGDDMKQPASEQDESKQTTAKGYEIPVPTKEQVMGFFKKVARAPKRT